MVSQFTTKLNKAIVFTEEFSAEVRNAARWNTVLTLYREVEIKSSAISKKTDVWKSGMEIRNLGIWKKNTLVLKHIYLHL